MPPIFGILNTNLQRPDFEMINRIKDAANYIKPRSLEVCEVGGGFLATAVIQENPLNKPEVYYYRRCEPL
jgi:hypothetical protein